MTDPDVAWQAERGHVMRKLALLQEQLDVLADGKVPDYERMLQLLHDLRMQAVQAPMPGKPEPAARARSLIQGCRVIGRAGETLHVLLEEALEGAMSRDEIEAATATYLAFCNAHFARDYVVAE